MRKLLIATLLLLISTVFTSGLEAQNSVEIEIDNRLHTADSLRRRIKYSDAWNQLSLVGNLENKMSTSQLAKYYKLVGVIQFGLGETEIALQNYAKSKETLKKLNSPKSKIDFVNLYTLIGAVYNETGEYEKAKETLLEGENAVFQLEGKDSLSALKYLYNNLAGTYEFLGNYDNSVRTSNKVLTIIEQLGNEKSVAAGVANNSLGICYRQLGRHKLAEKHYNKAAEIFSTTLGPNSRYTLAALGNAATAIDNYGDAEKAIPILMRKLEVYLEDPGADQLYLTTTYSTLGWIYYRIGDYDKSADAFERALGKMRSIGSTKKDLEIRILRRLAQVEIRQDKFEQAKLHLQEAEALEEKHQVLTSGEIIRLYSAFSTFYHKTEEKTNQFQYAKKAYLSSLQDSSISLELRIIVTYNYANQLIQNLEFNTAQILIENTSQFLEQNIQKAPVSDITEAKAMVDVLRANIALKRGDTSIIFAENIDDSLQSHVLNIIQLVAATPGKKNQKYACNSCFGVSNILQTLINLHLDAYHNQIDVKGNHLQKALAALDINQQFITNIWNNQYFSSLSSKDRERAVELRQRIAAYDLMMFENNDNSMRAQKRNTLYLDSILILRPQLSELIQKLKSNSINFNTRFDYPSIDEDFGILIFHQHDENLHQFTLTNSGISLNTIPNANKLRKQIEAYNDFCKNSSAGFSESLETLKSGKDLYEILIPSNFRSLSRIAVIQGYPTEELPFAALLTEAISEDARGFRDVQFAVEQHSFSYHQSLSNYFESQSKDHFSKRVNLTALAPSQISGNPIASNNSAEIFEQTLAYAKEESEILSKKYNGQLLTGRQADFDGFTDAFETSEIVHIASHATSNYDAGEYSYIIVTDTSSLSGERLYARTISELDLPTNLVVLGACESGSGKLSKGEGTVSLANVFLNAGSLSVLHTSWRVEDKRSQEVLFGFYDAFMQKVPLDKALGEAQTKYLQTASGQYLHPFYWAPFEVSGKLTPIDSTWNYFLFGGLLCIAVLGVFFLTKRR